MSVTSDGTVFRCFTYLLQGFIFGLVYLNRPFPGFVKTQIALTSKEFSSETRGQICIKFSQVFLQILFSKTVFYFFDKPFRSAAKYERVGRFVNLFVVFENVFLEVHKSRTKDDIKKQKYRFCSRELFFRLR